MVARRLASRGKDAGRALPAMAIPLFQLTGASARSGAAIRFQPTVSSGIPAQVKQSVNPHSTRHAHHQPGRWLPRRAVVGCLRACTLSESGQNGRVPAGGFDLTHPVQVAPLPIQDCPTYDSGLPHPSRCAHGADDLPHAATQHAPQAAISLDTSGKTTPFKFPTNKMLPGNILT